MVTRVLDLALAFYLVKCGTRPYPTRPDPRIPRPTPNTISPSHQSLSGLLSPRTTAIPTGAKVSSTAIKLSYRRHHKRPASIHPSLDANVVCLHPLSLV
ncbi:hypothetical protein B0H16DRAFT_927692 [Mycena metata]|uniref:Uncharacterized protein n=1 Tax=Mycena metata TaxID=1033252 RepID=A0AAD7INR8_9AGAR|nr:hypothetical protein B0H16DRAFT_927692 [Mycena metata]